MGKAPKSPLSVFLDLPLRELPVLVPVAAYARSNKNGVIKNRFSSA
jgi:hypothetical protein